MLALFAMVVIGGAEFILLCRSLPGGTEKYLKLLYQNAFAVVCDHENMTPLGLNNVIISTSIIA